MISYLDCYPCLVRHALEASRFITGNEALQREVMNRVMRMLPEAPPSSTPVRLAAEAHRIIRETLGVEDPYAERKKESNAAALALLPWVRERIAAAPDRLSAAVRAAIAGNVMDFGALGESFDVHAALEETLSSPLGVDHLDRLREKLGTARRVAYVADNAGEIAFDRLLVEEILEAFGPEVTVVVRGRPILNDATLEDAEAVGLTGLVQILPSEGDGPGCELDRAGPRVRTLFEAGDLVISKGQGNYEALSNEPFPFFFLLRVKCRIIAVETGAEKGEGVVKYVGP